ncbi:MAG: glycoside hydrolase family 3 N-terminal domain-containing protein [Desulfobulbaceae bacterium]|nr:glycoside hydrolase family 3 N-terminal domain-containing protein [Desulfobulbaceae bacterium]
MQSIIPDLGQMFLVGFEGSTIRHDHWIAESIIDECLGGVILFDKSIDGSRRNIESSGQLLDLISTLQGFAEIPLFIAIDQEGGQVSRLKESDGFPATRSAGFLSRQPDPAEAAAWMEMMATTLALHGINLNLAPVVDLDINPENPIISRYERSYGKDVDLVVRYASMFIEAHHRHGVACCLKHFPGHGSSREDSHLGFVDITDCWQERELEPYKRLFAAGIADAVMTAHVIHRGLDPQSLPATLSGNMLNSLLRRELGFSGLIVSDDLQMKAISKRWNLEEAVQMAVLAGVDLIVIGNNLALEKDVAARGIRAIEKLLADGRIDEERLYASLERIGALKKKIAGEEAWKNDRPTTC